jgi:hypothetical protein
MLRSFIYAAGAGWRRAYRVFSCHEGPGGVL